MGIMTNRPHFAHIQGGPHNESIGSTEGRTQQGIGTQVPLASAAAFAQDTASQNAKSCEGHHLATPRCIPHVYDSYEARQSYILDHEL